MSAPLKSVGTTMSSFRLPSPNAYQSLKQRLKRTNPILWKNLPKENSGFASALCFLWENPDGAPREELIKYATTMPGAKIKSGGDNLQVRHLSTQKGFNIIKDGEKLKLVDLVSLCPSYIPTARCNGELTNASWQSILATYDNMCVNCGSVSGQPQRWNPRIVTKLQRGHMDPRKPLSLSNCIPQCSSCNQQYKDKAIFNIRGFVVDFDKNGFKNR